MNKTKKTIIFIIAALAFTFNSFAEKNGYEITVKLKNSTDTACYMAYYFGAKKYIKDTAITVKPNQFVFKGKEPLPGGIYIIYFADKSNFEVLINEQHFSIELDKNNLMNGINFKGSEENTLFYEYLKFANDITKEITPYQNSLKRLKEKNDKDSIKIITQKLSDADKKVKEYREKIIKEYPNKLITTNFLALKDVELPPTPTLPNGAKDSTFAYRYTKKHYWDNIDFTNSNILRTPIYESKLLRYFDKMLLQTPDTLKKECDYIVGKAKANKEIFQFTVITLTNKYGKSKIMGLDEVFVHMIENYYSNGQAFWLDSAGLYRLQDRAKTIKYTLIGNPAPNLTMKDTTDKYKVLYNECYADFNIVIFWDPDCGHCKKEIPKWNKEYNELKKEYSIHMIGITTSTLKEKWLKFIRSKKIGEWQHLYDPDYKSPFRQLYDITSTPKVYIIGKDKKMIAKQIGPDQIADFIKRKKRQMDALKKKGN